MKEKNILMPKMNNLFSLHGHQIWVYIINSLPIKLIWFFNVDFGITGRTR